MKIIAVKDLEDCFDGSFMKEALFDAPVDVAFIEHIGKSGKLSYHPSFCRPFYRVDMPDGCIVKGVEGNSTARVILQRDDTNASLLRLESAISSFSG